jgi:hypothetical protein
MRKLSKNSKVVVGAATLLLFAFAGSHSGAIPLQAPRLDSSALRSQAFSAHGLAFALPHLTLVKARRPARSVVAEASIPWYSRPLRFAGAATCETLTANDPARRCAPQPRAPPLS